MAKRKDHVFDLAGVSVRFSPSRSSIYILASIDEAAYQSSIEDLSIESASKHDPNSVQGESHTLEQGDPKYSRSIGS